MSRRRSGGTDGRVDAAALDLATVADRVRARAPRHDVENGSDPEPWQAATALVLSPGPDGLAIAFIERVERTGDRWSGQMALPGGKRELDDLDLAVTAARETAEEVGLDLPAPIGRLSDQRGRVSRGVVATYVFGLHDRPELAPDPAEAVAADWIALSWLVDPANAVRTRWAGVPFAGIAHRDRIIWGLTHRILGDFASTVGLVLPRP